MKSLLLFALVFALTSYTYAQDKNYKFCREVITANQDYSVVTKFTIDHPLTDTELEAIKSNLFVKSSIYSVITNSKRTEILVYHLSEVHLEDLKLLTQSTNILLDFVSTEDVEFGPAPLGELEIER